MRELVLGLLKSNEDRCLEDREVFKSFHDHFHSVDNQLNKLNKTVFEDGNGIQVFDILKSDIVNIRQSIKDLDDATQLKVS